MGRHLLVGAYYSGTHYIYQSHKTDNVDDDEYVGNFGNDDSLFVLYYSEAFSGSLGQERQKKCNTLHHCAVQFSFDFNLRDHL